MATLTLSSSCWSFTSCPTGLQTRLLRFGWRSGGGCTTATRPLATSSKESTIRISSSIWSTTTFPRKTASGSCWRKLREIDRGKVEEKRRDKARRTNRPSYTLFYRIYFVHKLLCHTFHTYIHLCPFLVTEYYSAIFVPLFVFH